MKKILVTSLAAFACVTLTFAADVYVDSLLGSDDTGAGTEANPYQTIRKGAAEVGAGDTVYIRGGDDREYLFSNDADQVVIDKAGVTLESYGDQVRAEIRMSDNYAKDATNEGWTIVPPIEITADNVTLRDIYFHFGVHSLGYNYGKPSTNFIRSSGSNTVITVCHMSATNNLDRYSTDGSGKSPIQISGATPVIAGCFFEKIDAPWPSPIVSLESSSSALTFENNFVSNCNCVVGSLTKRPNASVISNRFVNCSVSGAPQLTEMKFGLFRGAANGINKLTLAYNIFYNDSSLANIGSFICYSQRETFAGGLEVHHNTVIGYDNLIVRNNLNYSSSKCLLSFFDNIVYTTGMGTLFYESAYDKDSKSYIGINGGANSGYLQNSYIKNNAFRENVTLHEIWANPQPAEEDFLGIVTVENNPELEAMPEFISLDPHHPDFCRLRVHKKSDWVFQAWTDNDTYPKYLGAQEPVYAAGFSVIVR